MSVSVTLKVGKYALTPPIQAVYDYVSNYYCDVDTNGWVVSIVITTLPAKSLLQLKYRPHQKTYTVRFNAGNKNDRCDVGFRIDTTANMIACLDALISGEKKTVSINDAWTYSSFKPVRDDMRRVMNEVNYDDRDEHYGERVHKISNTGRKAGAIYPNVTDDYVWDVITYGQQSSEFVQLVTDVFDEAYNTMSTLIRVNVDNPIRLKPIQFVISNVHAAQTAAHISEVDKGFRIVLFAKNFRHFKGDKLKHEIRKTVYHELSHYVSYYIRNNISGEEYAESFESLFASAKHDVADEAHQHYDAYMRYESAL